MQVDRIFVSVNYDTQYQDLNDVYTLCRYEFVEILPRLAYDKFYITGKVPTMHQALEKLVQEHILPNNHEQISWQTFRSNHVWNLDVDDTLRPNLANLELLYTRFAASGLQTKKYMSMQDALNMYEYVHQNLPNFFKGSYHEQQRLIALSYGLSKMTIEDEFEEIEKFNMLEMCEFYEFLCRWASLLVKHPQKTVA